MTLLTHSAFCTLKKIDELDCIEVQHPKLIAQICLQGAQLTQFTHHDKGPFVWLSPSAQYKQGQSLRGGVPICWPWFGVLEKNPETISHAVLTEKNAHGFARTQIWQLHEIKESAHGVSVELELTANPVTRAIWPYDFSLRCRFHFSDTLSIELTTSNLGKPSFTFSQALHTYLGVNKIEDVRISGAHQHSYVDALDRWQSKQQNGHITIKQEVDRVYTGAIDYGFFDGKNNVSLTSSSASSVVWNPWINKSKTLSQFPHTAYKNMLCIESGNILDDVVTLKENERHCLTMTLTKD
ncbi:MAG: D-hexose-6-phosphate mutarotase [Bermanella sp.]